MTDGASEHSDGMLRKIVCISMPIPSMAGEYNFKKNREALERLNAATLLGRPGRGEVAHCGW